jgi:GNAT superfamily N-acetyltransferase
MRNHDGNQNSGAIRACVENDEPEILRIVNLAAVAYRGVIPADCWHEPYMSLRELRTEIAAGVRFTGYAPEGALVGVMGIQEIRNVRLIRHAYVLPEWQGHGIGSKLLDLLRGADDRPVLIGTWQAASWAIRFYQRHGFALVPRETIAALLQTYWNVPERQIDTSVVLASPALSADASAALIAAA